MRNRMDNLLQENDAFIDISTIVDALTQSLPTSESTAHELTFLTNHTGLDETTIMAKALHVGLNLLYRQIGEQLFIDDRLSHQKAVNFSEKHESERLSTLNKPLLRT